MARSWYQHPPNASHGLEKDSTDAFKSLTLISSFKSCSEERCKFGSTREAEDQLTVRTHRLQVNSIPVKNRGQTPRMEICLLETEALRQRKLAKLRPYTSSLPQTSANPTG